jgi:hypothetical protein
MKITYPFVRCEVTGQIQPGYAICTHLAIDGSLPIADMTAPTKKSLGVIVCHICNRAGATVPLVICCGLCTEAGLLKAAHEA